jgi:3-hydroxyisobutyrate dehydrogenase-like beta-hydroxyacid dehydrogenase
MAEVALIGVGRMGAAMARKLVEADAEIVISMLSSGAVTESILLADDVLAELTPGTLVCDMATSGVATAKTLQAGLAAAGARFIDAPVSGSVASVESRQLLVMASGDPAAVEEAEGILKAFAKRVVYLGPAGNGQSMKLAVNLVVHALNAALSEALTLAVRSGISAEAAYDVFSDSSIAAPFVLYKRAAFLEAGAPVAMSLGLTSKDLGLITDFAREQGVAAVVADAVRDEVAAACAAGFADDDMAALARFLQSRSRS